jgi:hypothetical protein
MICLSLVSGPVWVYVVVCIKAECDLGLPVVPQVSITSVRSGLQH